MIELNQAEHEHEMMGYKGTGGQVPRAWRPFGLSSKLIVVILLALSAAAFLLAFASRSLLARLSALPNGRELVDWLINENGSWIVGGALFALLLLFLLLRRYQMVSDRRLWVDSGCPQCMEQELVRIPRKRSDRWYSLIVLPAFRYACRNCTWQGLRIARRYVRPETAILAEAQADAHVDVTAGYYDEDEGAADNDMVLSPAAVLPGIAMEHRNGGWTLPAEDEDEGEGVTTTITDEGDATDEEWEPFVEDEVDGAALDELEGGYGASTPVRPADYRQNLNRVDEATNHKVRDEDDEFEWLWRQLGQND